MLAVIYGSVVVAFFYDLTHTETLAVGMCYLPMIWTAIVIPDPRAAWRLAGVAILLVVIGAFVPTVASNVVVDVVNRSFSIAAILATAGFVRYERQVRDRLSDQARALKRADEAKMQMLANLSHELRTPLNAVLGFAQLLRAAARTDQQMPLTQIDRAGRRLLSTFENLIDLTSIGQRAATIEPVELGALAADAVESLRAAADERRITVGLAIDEPITIRADRWAIGRVLGNIVSNAIKFSPVGATVRVRVMARDAGAAILVADDGPGMTPDITQRIGETFYQADAGTTRRFEGMGAGLALALRLTAEMGGKLDIDTAPGQGTRVTLLLPPAPPQASR